jgi:serine protease Do
MTLRHALVPGRGRWLAVFLGLGILIQWSAIQAGAIDDGDAPLPAAFDKALPENIKDLQAIQQHVKSLLKKTMAATVGVQVGGAQGSGVIITKEGIILTAGHVSAVPDRDVKIVMSDGRTLKGKTLGANHIIDSGMIKITQKGEYPFCEMAVSADLKVGQWCMAIGHPGGVKEGRNPVVRLGRIQKVSDSAIQTDCTLVGGDSGGPLFDMHGKVIGIHSRIADAITTNIHVPVDTYRDTWDRLAKGEEWGKPGGKGGKGGGKGGGKNADPAYMGLYWDRESKDCRVLAVNTGSPAAKAGLLANDIIQKFDGKSVKTGDDLEFFMSSQRPGNEIALVVKRGNSTVELRVMLGKKPPE